MGFKPRLAKWYRSANDRRLDLLSRCEPLTEAENAELDMLTKKCWDEANRVWPLTT